MKRDEQDVALAEIFDEVHRADAPPSFDRLYAAAPQAGRVPRRRRWALAGAAVACAAAVAIAIPLWGGSRPASAPSTSEPVAESAAPAEPSPRELEQIASSLDDWRAPTDFLLDTPGSSLLTETPRFGGAAATHWPEREESSL